MSTTKKPPQGFRETSWFAEGVRKSELHKEAAATGEELPEDNRTLEERYQGPEAAPASRDEAALSLRTGDTGAMPVVTSVPKKDLFQRDTAGALRAVVRTPMARLVRGLFFTGLALLIVGGGLLAAYYTMPGFAGWVRALGR